MTDREYFKMIIVEQVIRNTKTTHEQRFNTLLELMLDMKEKTNSMMNSIFSAIEHIKLDEENAENHEAANAINGIRETLIDNAFLGLGDLKKQQPDDLAF
jgi:hypothetical protein